MARPDAHIAARLDPGACIGSGEAGAANVEFMMAARSVLPAVVLGPGIPQALEKRLLKPLEGRHLLMWSVPEEPSEAVIADSEICLLRWRGSSSLPHSPMKPTGQVVSRAGDIVRSKALDFLVDHAEIASEGESLRADEDSTEAVSEPPEQDRAEGEP